MFGREKFNFFVKKIYTGPLLAKQLCIKILSQAESKILWLSCFDPFLYTKRYQKKLFKKISLSVRLDYKMDYIHT